MWQDPLAGNPRVTDKAAGISYGIPDDWKQRKGELIKPFTSTITKKPKGPEGEGIGSTVIAGPGGAVPEADLKRRTESAAWNNAVFFYPNGDSTIKSSESITVDGRPAHTVTSAVEDGEGGEVHLQITIVTLDDSRSAFLIGLVDPLGSSDEGVVDAVVDRVEVL
ncbi:hypothetical protein QIS99_24370 [Streptomyces sp. B-S-A8]|uniref:Uncharacterized protein n=1 Tax=Streptomyces solicavernae TaxID=3043614 RepID=A0ABT6RYA9_9ACTN|nr:hypothetical protein [Streptomyces sp. B-S-A8]MDI3389310.1 hypothetical protein [Streptomyces sp. B-S-A8]